MAILGPKHSGKTTAARQYLEKLGGFSRQNYFDLESYLDLKKLKDPLLCLPLLSGLIVIDEVQKVPSLFKTLGVLVDNKQLKLRCLILGSTSRDLIQQSSETLAGRITYLELSPFHVIEIPDK